MRRLTILTRQILISHSDPNTNHPEDIILGYCDNEVANWYISRYILSSRLIHGVVLDSTQSSCYESSILGRSENVKLVTSVDIDKRVLQYGRIVYDSDCICADCTLLPFRGQSFNPVVSIETLEHIKNQDVFLNNIKFCLKKRSVLVLSTPSKLCISSLIPKSLNPYHTKEYYLGPLLIL